jgi:DnaK suppressor protein
MTEGPVFSHDSAAASGLSRDQISFLEAKLRAERETLSRRVATRRRALAEVPARETDESDWASDAEAQSLAVRLVDRDAKMLHEIDAALRRIADGEYGLCDRTGEPIGFERLAARPWTRFALVAKEEEERQRAGAGSATGVVLGDAADLPERDQAA